MFFWNLGGTGPLRLVHTNRFRLIYILLLRTMSGLVQFLPPLPPFLSLHLVPFSILYNTVYSEKLRAH